MLSCRRTSGDSVQTLWQAWAIVRGVVFAAGAAFGEAPLRVECHFVWQVQYLLRWQLPTVDLTFPTISHTFHSFHCPLQTSHP